MGKPIVGYAGMTHLGIISAVAAAERGFVTVAYDSNDSLITQLNQHILPVTEPQLPELFAKQLASKQLTMTTDVTQLTHCDIVYIAPDVATDEKGRSDLSVIHTLLETVIPQLSAQALLVILSQVPPTFTRKLQTQLAPAYLYYQVETLIFGRAMERALHPERFIIGCADQTIEIDARLQIFLDAFACPILPMRYESAELAKISINCCLVASIQVANLLSDICEKINADWYEIAPALKLDKRIGKEAYLAPGLGIAGGNLERDLATVLSLSHAHGTESNIVQSWLHHSQYKKNWVLRMLHQKVFPLYAHPTFAILGLAYKENTHSTKNSPALALIPHLTAYPVQLYDPVVNATPIISWAHNKTSMEQAVMQADVLIIMTPWPEFRTLTPQQLKKTMRGKTIIDPYRVLKSAVFEKEGFHYLTLGRKESHVETLANRK